MVNSPSRPNSRPPVPVECGGMTPLWNWETCLPADRPTMTASSPDIPLFGSPRPGWGRPVPTCSPPNPNSWNRHPARSNQGRIKAKNPVIVPHQGKSRHTRKPPWHLTYIPEFPICVHPRPSAVKFPRLPDLRNPKSVPESAPIKANPPAIKANPA